MIDEEEYGDSVQPFDLGHYHPENRGDDLPPSLLAHSHVDFPNRGRGQDYYHRHPYQTPKTKEYYGQRNTMSHSPYGGRAYGQKASSFVVQSQTTKLKDPNYRHTDNDGVSWNKVGQNMVRGIKQFKQRDTNEKTDRRPSALVHKDKVAHINDDYSQDSKDANDRYD